MGDIEKRFLEFCDWLKATRRLKTDTLLASTLGITRANLAGIRINKSGVGTGTLVTIATNHPQLNVDWLLTGRGAMLEGKKVLVSTRHGIEVYRPAPYNPLLPDDDIYDALRGADEYMAALEAGKETTVAANRKPEPPKADSGSEEWKNKYFQLLEKYNNCLEKLQTP